MGREVRRVPGNWQHPRDGSGNFVPLFDDYDSSVAEWDIGATKWAEGLRSDYAGGWVPIGDVGIRAWDEWAGPRPLVEDYMPRWAAAARTHYMMYETTSEGTPISPAFATPEELAEWLAGSGASAFADQGASYESWLRVARGGYACSAVLTPAGMVSGVEALSNESGVEALSNEADG